MASVIVDLRRRCVSLKEGSQILGVSEMTFRRMLRSGRVKSFRVGGRRGPYRIAIDEIESFIARASEPVINKQEQVDAIEIKQAVN